MGKIKSSLVYGPITGGIMVATAMIIYFTDLEFMPLMYFVVCIPLMTGVVLSSFAFSKVNEGYVSFKQVFENCFYVAMIAVGMLAMWELVSFVVLTDRRAAIIAENNERLYQASGRWQEPGTTNVFTVYYYAASLFRQLYFTLLLGTIFAVIGAAVTDTNRRRPPEEDTVI